MPVSGTFLADFSKFNDAVEQAETKLVSFETDANKVGAALSRMEKALSGKQMIQQATLMAEAVDRLGGELGTMGGIAKLTGNELQRMGAQATEAIEKMRAAGVQEIPANLTAIANAAKDAESAFGPLGGAMGQVFAGFTAANLVTKIGSGLIEFGKSAVEDAGALVDLSNKTFLSMTTLQQMDHVARQAGSNMEEFSAAAFKMGVNIQDGTAKARQAAIDLGLDWARLRAAAADDQFHMVIDALEGMEKGQRRNADAVALFGRAAGPILQSIADGYNRIAKEANVAGDAQVHAVDDASDAWDAFVKRQKTGLIQTLGSNVLAAQELERLQKAAEFDPTGRRNEELSHYYALMKSGAGDATAYLLALADQFKNFRKDVNLPVEGGPAAPSFTERLKTAEEHYAALTNAQRAEIQAALDVGASNDDIINGMLETDKSLKLTDDDLNLLKKSWQDESAAAKKATADEVAARKKADKAYADSAAVVTKFENALLAAQQSRGKTEDEQQRIKLEQQMADEMAAVQKHDDWTVEEK